MSNTRSVPGRWRSLLRALRVVVGCVLLTTCGTDSLAPRPPVRGDLDLGALLALREFPIAVDEIRIELRRSDESLAFDRTLTTADFQTGGTGYRVPIQVELNESPETFLLYAEVRAAGIVYYLVNSTVTATLGRTVTTEPITPTYVGPGANADSVRITLLPSITTPGVASVATAVVYEADAPVAGVPVEISTLDSALIDIQSTGFATASVTPSQTASGGYVITARTPTQLTSSATLTVVTASAGADSLEALSVTSQTAIVNQLVAAVPQVRVLDVNNAPLANVPVTFTVVSGGGTITGGSAITDSEGDAALSSWRVGQTAGANTVQATVAGVTPLLFTATGLPTTALTIAKISGDTQTDSAGRALAQPLVAEVRDSFANPIPGAAYSWAVSDGTIGSPTGTTNSQGRVSGTWTLGLAQASPTATLTSGPAQTIFAATVLFGQPTISLGWAGIPGVGIGLTASVTVTVNSAPTSTLAIALESSNTGLFTVSAPDTVYISSGQTSGSKTINGISAGSATLTASAVGYASGTLSVTVQNRQISLPTTLNVPYGQTSSLPIQLPAPAPAGGVTFAVASSDPTLVGVATPTVTIAAGGQTANATLNGVLPGPASVTVTNVAYETGTTAATTSASLNIVQTSVAINASFGGSITINFESNGAGAAAPAPGIPVTVTARNPACVSVQSPRTIPTGLVNVTSALAYGGSATLPCTDTVVVTATNLQPDSLVVSVAPLPTIALILGGGGSIGQRLEEAASLSLAVSNHGGTSVTLTSSDPAVAVLSSSPTVAGTGTLVIPILPGGTFASFYVQSVGALSASVTITATAPNFANGTLPVSVVTPGVEVVGVVGTTTTLSANIAFYAQVGLPNGQATGLSRVQNVTPGQGSPIVVTATSQFPAVGLIVDSTTSPTGAATGISVVREGNYYTTGSLPSPYGLALRPLTTGVDTVRVSIPGFTTMTTSGAGGISVIQPVLSVGVNAASIGSGLQTSGFVSLSAGNHGGASVTLTSGDPSSLLLSLFPDSVGSASVTQSLTNGQQSFSYYLQALDGATAPSISVIATEPRFVPDTVAVALVTPGIELQGVPGATTTLSGNFAYYAQVGTPNGPQTGLSTVQNRRAGGAPIVVSFTTSDTLVLRVVDSVTQPTGGTTGTAPLRPGFYYTPASGPATAGIAGRPMGAGDDTLRVSAPGFTVQSASGLRVVTVSQPTLDVSVNYTEVGSGLVEGGFVSLSATSHGGASVTLTSSDPSKILLDTLPNGPGHTTIVKPLANGQGGFSYYLQALEGQTGGVTVTATEPRFATDSVRMTAVTPGVELQAVPGSLTTLSPDANIYAQIGVLNGQLTGLARVQNTRGGASGPVTVTFTATPASVATIIDSLNTPVGAATGTARIPRGFYYTPPQPPANGGIALHPVLNGSVTVTVAVPGFTTATVSGSRIMTISQPGISLSVSYPQVGSGLQEGANGSLGASNHGGVIVTLVSSDPSVFRLSRTPDSAGTASIQITVPNGQTFFSYFAQGVEGATGTPTITATASGFTNGTVSEQVITPALEVQGLSPTLAAAAANQDFYAQVGIGNGQLTGLARVQNVRGGAPSPVTVTFVSSTPGVGTLVTTAGSNATRTANIIPQFYYTPTSMASGGVSFDPVAPGQTTVRATAPGFTPMAAATRSVTVQ